MVKTLQKKFIKAAMTAVTVLLAVVISTLNIANVWLNKRQGEQRLEMIINEESHMYDREELKDRPDNERKKTYDMKIEGVKPPEEKRPPFLRLLNPAINEDTFMSMRYFVVRTLEDGKIVVQNRSRISSVSEETAAQYTEEVLKKKKSTGYLDGFRYQVKHVEKIDNGTKQPGNIIVFLDVSDRLSSLLLVAVISIGVAIICGMLMLLFIVRLSKKAIHPIASSIEKQKQFVTDAGHEIKTPLAIIQANLDAMELINGENKWSKNIRTQTQRLGGLMQNLLTLAKADEADLNLPKSDVDLHALAKDTVHTFCESAALREIHIEEEIGTNIFIHANRDQMMRLMTTLLDNAVKYANDHGEIHVSLYKKEKNVFFEVENTCEELPDCAAEKLFDRFYRADSSRTQKRGGYGIGLSAARAIVESQKGEIQAYYKDNNIVLFRVILRGNVK